MNRTPPETSYPVEQSNTKFWTIAGVVVAIVGTWLGFKVVSREFGYDEAKIRLVSFAFADDRIVDSLMKASMFGAEVIGLNDLNDMIRLNPKIVIEALDDQPIEGIRVEVTPALQLIDAREDRKPVDGKMTPWSIEGFKAREYTLIERPSMGQKIIVPIADLLVGHMSQGQVKEQERKHRAHYIGAEIRVYAKLAGSPTWSAEVDHKWARLFYFWYPTGFPEQDCDDFTKRFNQKLDIVN